MSTSSEDTVEILTGQRFADTFFAGASPDFEVTFGAASDAGLVRPNNEDHYAVVKRCRTSELLLTNLAPDELVLAHDCAYGMVVADGMGGARFGEFASRLAVQRLFELAQLASSWVMKFTDMEAQQIRERVAAYVDEIQATLRDYIHADPALAGMGTTWTSAHMLLPHILVVHIGDSRAYLWHDGELNQITRDETMAQAYIDAGMDPQRVQKFRHILLNNLGGASDDVRAQIHHIVVKAGDRLLLCTDGLTESVADDEIAKVVAAAPAPQSTCDELVRAALARGGQDNITVVVAAITASSR